MKNMACLCLALLAFAGAAGSETRDDRLAEVQSRIEAAGFTWIAGHTEVSDIPWEVFRQTLGLRRPAGEVEPPPDPRAGSASFASRFDWRELGGTTPAKRQKQCGSCWAFAIMGAFESRIRIGTGRIVDVSEQQLVDCNSHDYGCDGGWLDGWEPLRDYGGVLESCYPYQAVEGPCRQQDCPPVEWADGGHRVTNSVDSIKYAVQTIGPVACAMTAYDDLSYYTSGCYDHADTEDVNHGVLIVGWDDSMCGGAGAWIIKNSWGEGWGENGFGHVRYESCRIGSGATVIDYTSSGSYPTPTPAPGDPFSIEIATSQEIYRPGDWFRTEVTVTAPSALKFDLYVVLDVQGNYWFWPSWGRQLEFGSGWWVGPGVTRWQILGFTWPAGAGSITGIQFHAAALQPGTQTVMGADSCSWGSAP